MLVGQEQASGGGHLAEEEGSDGEGDQGDAGEVRTLPQSCDCHVTVDGFL